MTERNKRVQEAATSAVATLEEETPGGMLGGVLGKMTQAFALCYGCVAAV
jgi:hypothetical protein